MNADELKVLIEQGEGQRLEFKASLSERPEIMATVSAFRNAEGGDILVGVHENGAPSGQVTIGANTIEELSGQLSREVDPTPFPTIDAIAIDGKTVIRVSLAPRRVGFVYFARGRAYVRVGRANHAMTAAEIRERHREGLEPAPLPNDWGSEENAPVFNIQPSVQNGMDKGPNKLGMTITVSGADVRPRYRWLHKDITNEWLTLTENPAGSREWRLRPPMAFEPNLAKGIIDFEAVFNWRGAECHARWEFPYHLEPKNTWLNLVLDTTLESLTQPKRWTEPLGIDRRA